MTIRPLPCADDNVKALVSPFKLSEVVVTSPDDRRRAVEYMAFWFGQDEHMNQFFGALCKHGTPEQQASARRAIFDIFLDDALKCAYLRSLDGERTACESWWTYMYPKTIREDLEETAQQVARGFEAIGWAKLFYGFQVLMAVKNHAVPKIDGAMIPHLQLSNIATVEDLRGRKHATAHIVAVCRVADDLNLPIALCYARPDNATFYAKFGFEDKERIPKLPDKCPFYNWMLRIPESGPGGHTMHIWRARRLLQA
ncbi:hypothetical protein HN358_02830 [Candidatus Uhrbacteria bacterium]|nr:hypothetical protein [Candidatus Uhrbacteria bacterium]MBT7717135.1 hypothetical protein [Candidatus Uhrbacteria bacterium]